MWGKPWMRLTVLLLTTTIASVGCDDDPVEDPCDGVANTCETDGTTRCAGGDGAVEACRENADGCLVWAEQERCDGRQSCDDSSGSPACACEDECDDEGDTSCDGDSIVTCTADDDGCRYHQVTTDCSDDGETCDDASGTPECVAEECTNECTTEGEASCDGNTIMTCQEGADGCLDLVETTDCADDGEICDDSSGTPECVAGCSDECDTLGETSCDGALIMTCQEGADGCLDLVETTDCADETYPMVCDDGSGTPECVLACVGDCDTAGAARCSATDVIETCTLSATDGCLYWTAGTDCAADDYICDDTGGTPACVGCGPCDEPGQYCNDTASPPECLMAGTIPEILEGVAADADWADLDPLTQAALRARAEYTLSIYREAFGPDALDDHVAAMLTAPTAEMTTNYAAFLDAIFGVSAVTNSDLDEALRTLYVLAYHAWQINMVNYHGMPAVTWDGVTDMTWFTMTDAESMDAYEALGSELTDELNALRADATLSAEDVAVAELAMAIARQLKHGSVGYHYGGDDLSTATGLPGHGFDFMLNYADFVFGNIFTSDDAFLDQLNAYYFADLIRISEGTVVAVDYVMEGIASPEYVGMFLGDPATNATAQYYMLLVNFWYDRVMAHPDITNPCYLYSDAEQARIWDAYTADSYDNNDLTTSFDSFHVDFLAWADEEIEIFRTVMADALTELFPSDSAAMSVAERDAIIAALDAAATLGEIRGAFDDGLTTAGDGSAPDVLAAAMAAVSVVGGRDYADATNGATWLAEDTAIVQAMWDEVRDWVLAEYGFDSVLIPEDLMPITEEDGYVVAEGYYYALGWPRSLMNAYGAMMRATSHLVSINSNVATYGPTYYGYSENTQGDVLNRFLAATLTGAEADAIPFYRLDGAERRAYILATNDAVIRLHTADACSAEGDVEWAHTVADEWGVDDYWTDVMMLYVFYGPWFLDYDAIAIKGTIAYLQNRLDTDYGAGTYGVDPFVLQACDVWGPKQDDATYTALVACVVP